MWGAIVKEGEALVEADSGGHGCEGESGRLFEAKLVSLGMWNLMCDQLWAYSA